MMQRFSWFVVATLAITLQFGISTSSVFAAPCNPVTEDCTPDGERVPDDNPLNQCVVLCTEPTPEPGTEPTPEPTAQPGPCNPVSQDCPPSNGGGNRGNNQQASPEDNNPLRGFLDFTGFLNATLLKFGKEVVRGLKTILNDAQSSSDNFLSQTPLMVYGGNSEGNGGSGFFWDTRLLFWIATTLGGIPLVAFYLAGFKLLPKATEGLLNIQFVAGRSESRAVIVTHFIITTLAPFSSWAIFIFVVQQINRLNGSIDVPLSEILAPNVDEIDSFVVLLLVAAPYLLSLIVIVLAEGIRLILMFAIGLTSIPASDLVLNKDWVPYFKQYFTWAGIISIYQTVILLILKFDLEVARALGGGNALTIIHTLNMAITAYILWKSRKWIGKVVANVGKGARSVFA